MCPDESFFAEEHQIEREFWLWKITGPLALTFGLIWAFMAIINVWPTVEVGENSAIAEATVVSAENFASGDSITRELGYEFSDHKGMPHYGVGYVRHHDRPRVGDIIVVQFNLDDPNRSALAEENQDVTMAVIYGLCAISTLFWKPIVFVLNLLPFVTVRATEVDDWPPV